MPRDRQHEEPQLGMYNEPADGNANPPLRNRQERRVEQAEQSQPPIEVPDREGSNSDKPRRSCDLDDDDDSLSFS